MFIVAHYYYVWRNKYVPSSVLIEKGANQCRQNAAVWDNMSTEERQRYVAENKDLGNKRYVMHISAISEQNLTSAQSRLPLFILELHPWHTQYPSFVAWYLGISIYPKRKEIYIDLRSELSSFNNTHVQQV